MIPTFNDANGFARADVTLETWRSAPYSRWSFQNLRDLVPTAEIACETVEAEVAVESSLFLAGSIDAGLEDVSTISGFLDYAHTDAFVVMRDGRIVAEHYAPHADVNARHVVFSVSKSLTAVVSGILEAEGVIDPDKPVTHYLPEAAGSAYGDCSYRDVLDMRVSLDFEEVYLDRLGAFARYRRAMLWNPPEPGLPAETLPSFLFTLRKAERPHGGPFFYASPNSDLLGVIIERATKMRFPELMSDLLWKPMGAKNHAYVTVDAIGTPRTAGGICVTARDLARVGELLRTGGASAGRQVVPSAWIKDMRTAGDHDAWAAGSNTSLPNGRYRSQWYQSGEADGAYCAIGIHGQWLYVDPSTDTVIVKLSSQPNPLDDELKQDNFAFFRAICQMAF
ncbi:serine hydrolase [Sinorhizobium sp. BG8]|uniref:serine hydrolase domain-containing protein n=1 Tax=Sinorhizobium sp. BG8 TaxID=2613773 RepID=UPI00193E8AB3|nr:serine hydrolase [Sinorhizobium sp. BG8]QRM57307.1 serine hydrolase [Sinorhizobium sp. BG8]